MKMKKEGRMKREVERKIGVGRGGGRRRRSRRRGKRGSAERRGLPSAYPHPPGGGSDAMRSRKN